MKRTLFLAAVAAFVAACAPQSRDNTKLVDPYIGSGGHGHVFVGANVPHGMVQLGPQQPRDTWDWCSGYHNSDTTTIGFSHTHLSGTGIGEGGDVLMLPYDADKALPVVGSGKYAGCPYVLLSHESESVEPGYYRLEMPVTGITAELTATRRVGIHKYTVSGDLTAIHLDLNHGIGWDSIIEQKFIKVSDSRIEGFRRSGGWSKDHIIYFVTDFSLPIKEIVNGTELIFDTSREKTLTVKTALSPDSCEKAVANLIAETEGMSFAECRRRAHKEWKAALGRIEVESVDATADKIFYTSFYHFMFAPTLFNNTDEGNNEYTFLSLWDTYRAASPLMTLIRPDMAKGMVETFLKIHERQGRLPMWHLYRCDTDCMVGNPGCIILADLFLKGFAKDSAAVLEALKTTSMVPERSQDLLIKYGYIPYDTSCEIESVSKGLEYAVADAGVAKVAAEMGDTVAEAYFRERSKSYRKYYDTSVGFMRGRAINGSFREPFDPFLALHMQSDFTEGNAWQYTFMVPHDAHGLIELLGGEEAFIKKIDELFVAEGDLGGNASDVTGLIGQYAHGNEPSHHMAYYYNYVGEQYKCAEKVRYILKELYTDDLSGVCGNEDAGQMSAWYILSSLGIYQVDPSGGDFLFGSPNVKKALVDLGNGKTLRILAPNNSDENIYIASVKVNGKPWTRSYISYRELVAGPTIEFEMSPVPTDFGSAPQDRP